MNGFEYLIFIGAMAQFMGTISYVKETFTGKVKPNRVTWLLWSIAPMIGTVAAISTGATWAILPVFMAGFNPFLVFVASFWNKKSYWKLGRMDYGCGALSILALTLWAITKQPSIAILLAILSDGLAAVPTITKTWKYPETEHPLVYATTLFSAFLGLMIVKAWTFEETAFQIYLMIICGFLVFLIYRKQIFPGGPKQIK